MLSKSARKLVDCVGYVIAQWCTITQATPDELHVVLMNFESDSLIIPGSFLSLELTKGKPTFLIEEF